jgi:hypothetical protein
MEETHRRANLSINNPYLTKEDELIIIKNLSKVSNKKEGIFLFELEKISV